MFADSTDADKARLREGRELDRPWRMRPCRAGRHWDCGGSEQDRGDGTERVCACTCHEEVWP